jgi:hypothetical protein
MASAPAGCAIVVDTCVARAAGQAGDAVALRCARVFDAIHDHGHQLAMSKPLHDEWLKPRTGYGKVYVQYASTYALRWLVMMTTARRVIWVSLAETLDLGQAILQGLGGNDSEAASKDIHLVKTALASDRRIVSLDSRSRRRFGSIGLKVPELCSILWLDPARHRVPRWLSQGAPDLAEYRLCSAGT